MLTMPVGMLLHWASEYLEKVLPDHLKARIKEPHVDPSHEMVDPVPYLNGETGEVMSSIPSDVITRVSRKKLRKFLTEGEDLNIIVSHLFEKRTLRLTKSSSTGNSNRLTWKLAESRQHLKMVL